MYTGVTESARLRDAANLNLPITRAEAIRYRRPGTPFAEQQANARSVAPKEWFDFAKALDTALKPFPEARAATLEALEPFLKKNKEQ